MSRNSLSSLWWETESSSGMQTNVSVSYKEIWSPLARLSWHLVFVRWTFEEVRCDCQQHVPAWTAGTIWISHISALYVLLWMETSLAFLITLPKIQKRLPLTHIHSNTELLQPETSQIASAWPSVFLNSMSAQTNCNTKDPQSKAKQWRVQISEVYQSQWEFSNLLIRHVFRHSLKSYREIKVMTVTHAAFFFSFKYALCFLLA